MNDGKLNLHTPEVQFFAPITTLDSVLFWGQYRFTNRQEYYIIKELKGRLGSPAYLDFLNRNLLMTKLLAIFSVALILAYISERNTKAILASGQHYSVWNDWAYILLVVVLSCFAGLRTKFNDTQNYIRIFAQSPGMLVFLSDIDNLDPLANPLFYFSLSLLHEFTENAQILIFLTATFSQCCFVWFIKRYSSSFVFSIFLYFTLGTFVLSMAALKQVMAMSILTLAIPYLEKKKWVEYYVVVLLAMLVHTYAIVFIVLPLFVQKPWRLFTYVFAGCMVVLLMNFQEMITMFLEQADEMGKSIAEYEVFDDVTINTFRLAIYAIPPLISFLFQKWIFSNSSTTAHVLIHMSIISVAFMAMGTQSGANMFGRMANYFELGMVCSLPWILRQTFNDRSYRLVGIVAAIGFVGFFVYGNAISGSFDQAYQATSFFALLSW